jgi:hypothetical protein
MRGAAFTDARKSAVTDGLTKAASMIGVGHEVFKGLVRAGSGNGRHGGNGKRKAVTAGGNGADATVFWELYNAHGREPEYRWRWPRGWRARVSRAVPRRLPVT